jgi:hypothetical protein
MIGWERIYMEELYLFRNVGFCIAGPKWNDQWWQKYVQLQKQQHLSTNTEDGGQQVLRDEGWQNFKYPNVRQQQEQKCV